ncbi:hypothetical protein FB451DRAFT_1398520 [Mycena latifolia]|nr:hypothetical protein FB451DRAFT_1398520 [Mycena latifolia]
MSSEAQGHTVPPAPSLDELKRQRRAEAQSRLREGIRGSRKATKLAAHKRHGTDADYRERQRKLKFIAKFGEAAFFDYYLPQHALTGEKHLPGLRFEYAEPSMQKKKNAPSAGSRKAKSGGSGA